MALIAEDGTGLSNAQSYCTLAEATAYHDARGNAAWAALASDTLREQALIRATDNMLQAYRYRWGGYRKTDTQALDWPRYEVPRLDVAVSYGYGTVPTYYPDNVVPAEVKNACAELALKASAGELAPDIARIASREKVGPIEVEYSDGATPWVRFRAVDNMLAGLLKSGGGGSMINVMRT